MNVLKSLEKVGSELNAKTRRLSVLLASQNFAIESLGTLSAEIAELKGKRDALDLIVYLRHGSDNPTEGDDVNEDLDDADIVNRLMDKVLRGADDAWSGRGNEIRRCHFEGFRSITQDFRQHVRIQAEQNKIDAEIAKPQVPSPFDMAKSLPTKKDSK